METIEYTVPAMSCSHCEAAIGEEVGRVTGVTSVEADAGSKRVVVRGERLDDAAIRAAIYEAGYDAT
jgi:copper chaperone CopZ